MHSSNILFRALNINPNSSEELNMFSRKSGVPASVLKHYNETRILPTGVELDAICKAAAVSPNGLQLKMGIINRAVEDAISKNADAVYEIIKQDLKRPVREKKLFKPVFTTKRGELYQGDCLDLLINIPNDTVDLVFADPPFNLNKLYPSKIDDDLKQDHYLQWCEEWLDECARVLKPGGSLFVWNLPKWNSSLSSYLNSRLTFRHWISVDIKYSLPILGRLYPSHYSLLYYCKGEKPSTFHPDRLPMEICPACMADLVDYGGYKDKMNPAGVNLADVWKDIPPVRHSKYKGRKNGNELSIKLLDRIIEMSSNEGDLVFDPFGGSGTTYMVSELKNRRWIGVEIGPLDDIIERFNRIDIEREYLEKIRNRINNLFTDENRIKREKLGLWTCESINKQKKEEQLNESKQAELQLF